MRKIIAVPWLLCLLCSCVGPQTKKAIDTSLGMTEEQLVFAFGVPTSSYQTENCKVIRYIFNQRNSAVSVPIGYGMHTAIGNVSYEMAEFYLLGGYVIKGTYKGPNGEYHQDLKTLVEEKSRQQSSK